ncbi:MAG TPA: cyclic nucleotide-binding domain-containing protein [Gaiellaceae bacterium]|jgi:CRP-like cAMP-binding protein
MLGKDAKLDLIRSVPLFEDCSRRELREIEAAVDEVVVPAGYTFTKEGASGKELIVIVEGAAEVRRKGRKINELGAGDFLGEIALISGAPRTATVRTTQPTHALVLTGQAFRRLVRQIPSMQMKVLEALARRLPADLG